MSETMTNKLYAHRNIRKQGQHYCDHLSAMTGEDLYDKSDIAAELAHRDIVIEELFSMYWQLLKTMEMRIHPETENFLEKNLIESAYEILNKHDLSQDKPSWNKTDITK